MHGYIGRTKTDNAAMYDMTASINRLISAFEDDHSSLTTQFFHAAAKSLAADNRPVEAAERLALDLLRRIVEAPDESADETRDILLAGLEITLPLASASLRIAHMHSDEDQAQTGTQSQEANQTTHFIDEMFGYLETVPQKAGSALENVLAIVGRNFSDDVRDVTQHVKLSNGDPRLAFEKAASEVPGLVVFYISQHPSMPAYLRVERSFPADLV